MDALILLGFFIALALAAPRWGVDSRDGVASAEYARRQAWWAGDATPGARVTVGFAGPVLGNWTPARTTIPAHGAATLVKMPAEPLRVPAPASASPRAGVLVPVLE